MATLPQLNLPGVPNMATGNGMFNTGAALMGNALDSLESFANTMSQYQTNDRNAKRGNRIHKALFDNPTDTAAGRASLFQDDNGLGLSLTEMQEDATKFDEQVAAFSKLSDEDTQQIEVAKQLAQLDAEYAKTLHQQELANIDRRSGFDTTIYDLQNDKSSLDDVIGGLTDLVEDTGSLRPAYDRWKTAAAADGFDLTPAMFGFLARQSQTEDHGWFDAFMDEDLDHANMGSAYTDMKARIAKNIAALPQRTQQRHAAEIGLRNSLNEVLNVPTALQTQLKQKALLNSLTR